jgi:small subunit ribosomal protein S9
VAKAAKESYFYGTGRRKTSVARVRLVPGTGEIIVNGIPYEERFPRPEHRRAITHPLLVTENLGKYNTVVKVEGGGITGQSGAISHGIARALVRADESLKTVLRQNGLSPETPGSKRERRPGSSGRARRLSTPRGNIAPDRILLTPHYLSRYNPLTSFYMPKWRNGRRATFRA